MPEVSHRPISACAAPRRLCGLDPSRSSRSTRAPFSYQGCIRAPSALFSQTVVNFMLIVLSCCRLSAPSVLSRSSISCTFSTFCLLCLPYLSIHTPGTAIGPLHIPQSFNTSFMCDKVVFQIVGGRGRMLVNKTVAYEQTTFASRAAMPLDFQLGPSILSCL